MSKAFVRSIKNVTNGYTSAQVKVRNATSNDAVGPSHSEMRDVAEATFDDHELFEVMDMIDRRLNDKGKNWRHVYKALLLLDFLIHEGSENVVLWCKDNLFVIKTLREFQYLDDDGRDQGEAIRSKAKELTSLVQDNERLREARLNHSHRRRKRREAHHSVRNDRFSSDDRRYRHGSRQDETDEELRRAMEQSRRTAEEDERRRKAAEGTDEDLRKAIQLSEEEEKYRRLQESKNLFDQQANLIDTDFNQQQQQQQQPMYYQQQGLTDIFGNPVYQQQPLSTGFIQNAYATGSVYPQYTGYPQQQQYAQQQQQPQYVQQAQPEPMQPLKTGSNNPFASQSISSPAPAPSEPTLNQMQPLKQQRTHNFDTKHMNELDNLLSNGEGMDSFGNVGEQRIAAQHTITSYISPYGMATQATGSQGASGVSNNPFMGRQYTGISTTNKVQPAFTGYGFGNAQQYQQSNNGKSNNLIDI